jgi:hypothetical protein
LSTKALKVKNALKKIATLIGGLILSFIIFEFAGLISVSKIASISKVIIEPIYTGELPTFFQIFTLLVSLVTFYWVITRRFLLNRGNTFAIAFSLVTAIYFYAVSPFWQFYMEKGMAASNAVFTSDQLIENNIIASSKGYYKTTPSEIISMFKDLRPILDPKDIPYVAMAFELDKEHSSQVEAGLLWTSYMKYLEGVYVSKTVASKKYKESYIIAFSRYSKTYREFNFKTKDNMNNVREVLFLANLQKYGINRGQDKVTPELIYSELESKEYNFVKLLKEYRYDSDNTKLSSYLLN